MVAHDLEASLRFYVDELGLEPLPTPDFGFPVCGSPREPAGAPVRAAGRPPVACAFRPRDRRVHARLPADEGARCARPHHIRQRMYELPNGGMQMYVRDPAGNLVELDCRDASTIPRDEVPEYRALADDPAAGGRRRALDALEPLAGCSAACKERAPGRSRAPVTPPGSIRQERAFWFASCDTGSRSATRLAGRGLDPGERRSRGRADADQDPVPGVRACTRRSRSGSGGPSGGRPSRAPNVNDCCAAGRS